MNCTVLIVDDEKSLTGFLSRILQAAGHRVFAAHSLADARAAIAAHDPDVVLQDLMLPDGDGASFMAEMRGLHPDTQFIIVTAHGSIRSAVESTQRGAADYLTKPVEPDDILLAVARLAERRALGEEVRRLRSGASPVGGNGAGDVLSDVRSPAMRAARNLAACAARQDGIVLLLGESGTGKDHLARWIHTHSPRAAGPFFAVNCAALPRELAESELFGHEPGAFTGTRGRKRGLLELAESGTLLLNEVGELDASLQSKLLSFLDTRSFLRVGGEASVSVNARIVAATNRELAEEVEKGAFRRDLYYRLNVFPIRLPALRERREDLPLLVDQVLGKLGTELGLSPPPVVEPDALAAIVRHPWPGNIRELRNVLERSLMLAADHRITAARLDLGETHGDAEFPVRFPGNGAARTLHRIRNDVTEWLIRESLRRAGSRQAAARLLGISRYSLAHYLKALGIAE